MDIWGVQVPISVVLGVMATVGYLVGRRTGTGRDEVVARSKRELCRAQAVARELERIAWMVRRNLARHHTSLNKFKQRVGHLTHQQQEDAWTELCREAEQMLRPTLRLATQIAGAYDLIRQQTNHLVTFAEVRTDPLTGVCNRRGLDDALATQFAMLSRHELGFSVVIFDIDHFKRLNDERGHLEGDRLLERVAKLLDESARETDIVARYGGEQFVVVMPQTDLEEASMFAERFRTAVEEKLTLTVSGGITTVLDGDTSESLLGRADAALHRAKSAGRNCIFRHDGQQIESIWEQVPAARS